MPGLTVDHSRKITEFPHLSNERLESLGIHPIPMEKPANEEGCMGPRTGRHPTKDTIRHLVPRPEPKNCQCCFANVVWPHMIGYAVGYANVLRSCHQLMRGAYQPDSPDPHAWSPFFRDRQKCYWCLDNADRCNHKPTTIVDSGLFSFISGAMGKSGDKLVKKFWEWKDKYDIYIEHAFKPGQELWTDNEPWFVELDAQGIIGVDKTWELRYQMKKEHPDTKFIYVHHLQDGMKNFDRMIEEFDYISVGSSNIPGMSRSEENEIKRSLIYYAKSKRPDIKIHFLGLSSEKFLRDMADVLTTCDSSVATAVILHGPDQITSVLPNNLKPYAKEWYEWVEKESGFMELIRAYMPWLAPFNGAANYTYEDEGWSYEKCKMGLWAMLCAFCTFNMYEAMCGPQALFCKAPDYKEPDAMFYKGMVKLMNWEKVSDADVERGPYDIYTFMENIRVRDDRGNYTPEISPKIKTHYELRKHTGPLDYQHIMHQPYRY